MGTLQYIVQMELVAWTLSLDLLVYDVTNRETFDALHNWWNEVNTYCSSPDVVKVLVGNKVDKVRQDAFGFKLKVCFR